MSNRSHLRLLGVLAGAAMGLVTVAAIPAASAQNAQGARLDQMMAMERQDFGVPPTQQLHARGDARADTGAHPRCAGHHDQGPVGARARPTGTLRLVRRSGPAREPAQRCASRLAGAGGLVRRRGPAAGEPAVRTTHPGPQGHRAGLLLPVARMLDVVQRRAARRPCRLHQGAVVSRRHRGMEVRRTADPA